MGKIFLSILLLIVAMGSILGLWNNKNAEYDARKQASVISVLNDSENKTVNFEMVELQDLNKKILVSTGLNKYVLMSTGILSLLGLFAVPFIGNRSSRTV